MTIESIAGLGDTATAAEAGFATSMANNPALWGSAWAHQADFFSIQISGASQLKVRVDADGAEFMPGVSIWAIGNAAFDAGTNFYAPDGTSNAGFGAPHSFNAYEALGSSGTLWMQDGNGGNAKELLGYAISGPSYGGATGWGETIENGVHDMSVSNTYETGVHGSTGSGFVELYLDDIADGYYAIYVGGTDASTAGGSYDLSVSAVPEPSTALLLLGGLGLIAQRRSRAS